MFSNSDLKNSKTISSPSPLYGTLLTISFLGYSQFKIFLIKSLIFFLNRFLINVFENGHFPQFRISLRWCRTISTRLSCFAVVDVPGKISAIHLDSAVRTRPLEISWLLFYSKQGVVRWNIREMKYQWDEISVRWNICEEKYRSEVLTNSIWAVLALFTCLLIESALDKYAYMRVPVKARPQNRYMSITIFVLAVVLDAAYCSLISLTTLRRCIRWALVCSRLSVNTLCMT